MIQGLVNFTDYFKDYDEDYVVISKNNEAFIKRLLGFIELAGYKTKQRTTNDSRHNLFRFFDSEDKTYPEQIELFAIHTHDSAIVKDSHIIPITTPEFYKYLSAILLDKDYFELLIKYTTNIEGLHIATPEVLIPLKIHAHINLLKDAHPDAKKHLTDVIRLATMLDDETSVILVDNPRKDYLEFLPLLDAVEPNTVRNVLKSAGVGKLQKTIRELLEAAYSIPKS
ncbi:MAG: hypothetical protein Q9M43_12430 [Sulfurimonas sp.]|nr:hypothetical protein [Sulfurimonas sp.]